MGDNLKPCPFCGGEAEIWRAKPGSDRKAWIACMARCGVLTREHMTDEEAVDTWNGRADVARIEALERELAEALEDQNALRDRALDRTIRAQRAEAALLPFAEAAAHLHPSQPDDGTTLDGIEVRHWRAAAQVVAKAQAH